ncbi:MAG: phage major capsid protein, partial [Parvularculaceae bacterium]|nr:phage major capsid protein [Parvularculaceae bacterium]
MTDDVIIRAWSHLIVDKAAVEGDARVIEGIATTPSTDRVGDVVEPEGVVFNADNLPPLLWQHDALAPVGVIERATVSKRGIRMRARFPAVDGPPGLKARIDEAWSSVKAGLVRGLSIGFRAIERAYMDNGGVHFQKWEWLELSLVTIPANADATITNIRSFDEALRGVSAKGARLVVPYAGVPATRKATLIKGDAAMATRNEQIAALQKSRDEKAARMASIQQAATDKGVTKTAQEREEFNRLADEIAVVDEEIEDLKRLELLEVSKAAKPVGKADSAEAASAARATREISDSIRVINREEDKGLGFARYALCFIKAKGIPPVIVDLAKQMFPHDSRIETYAKAAVAGGSTAVSAWAGALATPQDLENEFIEFLRPMMITGKFGANGVPPLRRVPANVKVNRQTGGLTGYFVGENAGIPLSKAAFDQLTMGKTKVAGIAAWSKETMKYATPALERTLRDDIGKAIVQAADTRFVSATAASAGVSPAGVLNGVTAIAPTGTGTAADIRKDVQNLTDPFSDLNIPDSDIVLITNSKTARGARLLHNALGQREFPNLTSTGGTLLDYPVITSDVVGAGDVIAVSASSILMTDEEAPTLDMTDQASLQFDDAPSADGTSGTGASQVSLWQNEMVAIKATMVFNYVLARAGAVKFIGVAAWNGSP